MELLERDRFLTLLQEKFDAIAEGEGHCIFVTGEAGIGKTSLVKAFCKQKKNDGNIYIGSCDALFTPRPLAPLYDILWQVNSSLQPVSHTIEERSQLFADIIRELSRQKRNSIIVFEDIHWADEATLDFIKFFARRITQLSCLFIVTYRDDERQHDFSLRNILSQIPPDSFTRLNLTPLSRTSVQKMAAEKGYRGEDVFSISGGNPFYVTEILSSYSLGVPENIRDSVISAYNRTDEQSKQVWDLLSVIPDSFEIKYLEKFDPYYATAIENCLDVKILLIDNGRIRFKHELFRRAIEASFSPLKKIILNKKILELFLEGFKRHEEIERIIHHAKNANEHSLVAMYAPIAAEKAARVGAHTEASKLYLSAIEYYQGSDKDMLLRLYEAYAYECYLDNQISQAIIYSGKSLELWKEKDDAERISNCLRFLSGLWWINDNLKKAEEFADESVKVLNDQPDTRGKAMAYANIAQLKMFSDLADECKYWGQKAMDLAKKLGDNEILCYALASVGSVQIRIPANRKNGLEMLQQSLGIALQNAYYENAGRTYTKLAFNGIIIKDNALAESSLKEGIFYCEENNLYLWRMYLLTIKAKLKLETGSWQEAGDMANELIDNGDPPKIIKIYAFTVLAMIKMRKGDKEDILPSLIESKDKALETMEPQRIIQAMSAFLEYEWITGQRIIEKETLDAVITMIQTRGNIYANSEFAFWIRKARKQDIRLAEIYEGYDSGNILKAKSAAALWKKNSCPYNEALSLSEGDDDDKRKSIVILNNLGADAVHKKIKQEMRNAGIKDIPRGIQKTTQANPAFLTNREMDILQALKEGLQNKEIAGRLFVSVKTVDNHISSIFFKLDVNSRTKAVSEAVRREIIK